MLQTRLCASWLIQILLNLWTMHWCWCVWFVAWVSITGSLAIWCNSDALSHRQLTFLGVWLLLVARSCELKRHAFQLLGYHSIQYPRRHVNAMHLTTLVSPAKREGNKQLHPSRHCSCHAPIPGYHPSQKAPFRRSEKAKSQTKEVWLNVEEVLSYLTWVSGRLDETLYSPYQRRRWVPTAESLATTRPSCATWWCATACPGGS